MASSGNHKINAIPADVVIDHHRLNRGLHPQKCWRVNDGAQFLRFLATLHPPLEHLPLLVRRWVTETYPEQEPVELSLRQGVSALILDRVGRGKDVERRLQDERLALDGDLALLHRFQEGGLCLG